MPMYLQYFASDRRHMKGEDGDWSAPPPLYDCIVGEGIKNFDNLCCRKGLCRIGDEGMGGRISGSHLCCCYFSLNLVLFPAILLA